LRLNTQYHMDPDVSHFPFQHCDLGDWTKKQTICDSVSVRRHTARNIPARYLKWVGTYLKKNVKDSKASVFVNVVDGVCFQLRQSTSKVNHRNMVAIFNIIKSMENGDIPVAYRQRRRSTRQSYLCKNILGSFDAPTSSSSNCWTAISWRNIEFYIYKHWNQNLVRLYSDPWPGETNQRFYCWE